MLDLHSMHTFTLFVEYYKSITSLQKIPLQKSILPTIFVVS